MPRNGAINFYVAGRASGALRRSKSAPQARRPDPRSSFPKSADINTLLPRSRPHESRQGLEKYAGLAHPRRHCPGNSGARKIVCAEPRNRGRSPRNPADAICINEAPDNGARPMNYVPAIEAHQTVLWILKRRHRYRSPRVLSNETWAFFVSRCLPPALRGTSGNKC